MKVDLLLQVLPPVTSHREERYEASPSASTFPSTDYKCIQTVFSSIDVPFAKRFTNVRKTKSQEDNPKDQTQNEMLEWLQEIYKGHKAALWNNKFEKIAEKLKRPGGEEKLKAKIRKYLEKVPSHFSDGDEEGKHFRENLPDYLIKKLKKVLLKKGKPKSKRNAKPEVFTVSHEEEDEKVSEINLSSITELWVESLPMKRKSSQNIQTIIEAIVQRLQPFMTYRPESNKDYRCMLKSYIMEILCELPLQQPFNVDKLYLNAVADDLVRSIIKLDNVKDECTQSDIDEFYSAEDDVLIKNNSEEVNTADYFQNATKVLEDLVTDEMTSFLEDYNLMISKNRMICIEMELVGIFLEELKSPGVYTDREMLFDVSDVLQEIGRIGDNLANIFSQKLIYKFKQIFHERIQNKYLKNALSDSYLVYYSPNSHFDESQRMLSDKIDKNLKTFTSQISTEIEQWLHNFKKPLPMLYYSTYQEMAVTELTEIIVNRYKYLELHPCSRGSVADESEHLKFLIFKWVRKLAGEDKIEVIQHVPQLLKNIQKITVPTLRTQLNLSATTNTMESTRKADAKVVKELYDEIFDWYFDLPIQFHDYEARKQNKQHIRKLAENIEKLVDCEDSLDEVIDREVDNWSEVVFNRLPTRSLIGELKVRIRNAYIESKHYTADVAMQAKATTYTIGVKTDSFIKGSNLIDDPAYFKRLVTKQIEEWLTSLPDIPMYDIASKHVAVKNLAADIIDRQKYLKLNPMYRKSEENELENLKYQIFKWLHTIVSDDDLVTLNHAPELMQRLRSFMPSEQYKGDNFRQLSITSLRPNSARKKWTDSSETALSAPTFTSRGNGGTCKGFRGRHGRYNWNNNIMGKEYTMQSANYPAKINRATDTEVNLYTNVIPQQPEFTLKENESHYKLRTLKSLKHRGVLTDWNKIDVYTVSIPNKTKISQPNEKPKSVTHMDALPPSMSLSETYEYFDRIFQKRCIDIPIDESTSEKKAAGYLARRDIYNGIWKTYFRLKSDPSIESDYTLFESMLDDHLDLKLDCLPQTEEMENFRKEWKPKIVADVTRMLEYVHNITDSTSFRQLLTDKFERQFVRMYSKSKSDINQHMFVFNTVDAYILYARHKTDNPLVANIYRQRLMRRLDELADHLKNSQNLESRLNRNQLCQEAFKVLGTVPLPDAETLKEEADEILVGDEIDKWYHELPTQMVKSELDNLLRKRTRDVLAKKIFEIEKIHAPNDDLIKRDAMQEIEKFLESDAQLEGDPTVNIDFFAQELANRLKNRKQTDPTRRSSLFTEPYNKTPALAPLVASQAYLLANNPIAGPSHQSQNAINIPSCQRSEYLKPEQRQELTNYDQLIPSTSNFVRANPCGMSSNGNDTNIPDGQGFASDVPKVKTKQMPYPIIAYPDPNIGTAQTQCEPVNGVNSGLLPYPDMKNTPDTQEPLYSDVAVETSDDEIRVRCQCTERFYKCLKKRKLLDPEACY